MQNIGAQQLIWNFEAFKNNETGLSVGIDKNNDFKTTKPATKKSQSITVNKKVANGILIMSSKLSKNKLTIKIGAKAKTISINV